MIWENSHSVKFREPIWGAPKENVTKSGKSPKGGEWPAVKIKMSIIQNVD